MENEKDLGLFVRGMLRSVNLTKSGEINGVKFGNSLKLKVEIPISAEKEVAGEVIQVEDLSLIQVKIKVDDETEMLKKYKDLVKTKNKVIKLKANLNLKNGDTFVGELVS